MSQFNRISLVKVAPGQPQPESELSKMLETYAVDIFDWDNFLKIYNYKYCDQNASENVKNLRGMIFNKKGQQLFKSVGYTEEYTEKTVPVEKIKNLEKYKIFHSEEGTLIKVFFLEEAHKWYVSTNKKLDAFKCKWGGSKESFGENFEKAIGVNLDEFTSKFDPNHMYLFLLKHTKSTRLVCNVVENQEKVLHVGTMNSAGDYVDVDVGISKPEKLSFATAQDLFSYVRNVDPFKKQGVILFEEGRRSFKILNENYRDYLTVRGNQTSIPFRYIQVRGTPMENKLKLLYPEYSQKFSEYDNAIKQISKNIYDVYVRRFIKKEFAQTDPVAYRIVKEAHGKHIADRNFKVTLNVIENLMTEEKFHSSVNQLVKNFLNPQCKGDCGCRSCGCGCEISMSSGVCATCDKD